MLKKILFSVISVIEKIINKKVVFIDKNKIDLNSTAALSDYGFWYAGNVFDTADISYGIAIQGCVEKVETNLVVKILEYISKQKQITLYDIGANSGYYGILSAFLYKDNINVYSFEPLLEYIDCIKKSIYLNRINNLKIFEFGLSNREEEKIIYLAGSGSTLEKGFSGDIKNERKVKTKKLDDVVFKNNIILPDFVKIDVEGHELKVLEGSENTILNSLPVLFVEIAYSMNNLGRSYINNSYKDTYDFLKKIGYKVYEIRNNKLALFNSNKKPDGVNMYLFLHKDKHAELEKYIINQKII